MMKPKIALICILLTVCIAFSSCGVIKNVFGVAIGFIDPFDRADAEKIIPRFDKKYFLQKLDDVYLENVCGIYRAVMNFENIYDVKGSLTQDQIAVVFNVATLEIPELFQLNGRYSLTLTGPRSDRKVKDISFGYGMEKDEYEKALASVEKTVAGFTERTAEMSDYEKEEAAFTHIAKNCYYDEHADHAGSAYGSLVLGRAKCDGISGGFKWLCEAAGLTCLLVTAGSKDGGVGHAWNLVKLGPELYNVDLTQSVRTSGTDSDGIYFHCFNVPDKWMKESYEEYDLSSVFGALPVCETFGQSYYAKRGAFVYEGEDPFDIMRRGLDSAMDSEKDFVMQFESAEDAEKFGEKLEDEVKSWLAPRTDASAVNVTVHGNRLYEFMITKRG